MQNNYLGRTNRDGHSDVYLASPFTFHPSFSSYRDACHLVQHRRVAHLEAVLGSHREALVDRGAGSCHWAEGKAASSLEVRSAPGGRH